MVRKQFATFQKALKALTSASFSARQAINHGLKGMGGSGMEEITEELSPKDVLLALKENTRQMGPHELRRSKKDSFTYVTGGGLLFHFQDIGSGWVLLIEHPKGYFSMTSALRKSLEEEGFHVPYSEEDKIEKMEKPPMW